MSHVLINQLRRILKVKQNGAWVDIPAIVGPQGPQGETGPKGDQGDPAPSELVVSAVEDWLGDHITNPSNPPLDTSLSLSNAAAPANKVGELKSALNGESISSYNNFLELGMQALPQTGHIYPRHYINNDNITPEQTTFLIYDISVLQNWVLHLTDYTGYRFWIKKYNGSTWTNVSTSWGTADYAFTSDGRYSIYVKNTAGTNLTQSDIDAIYERLRIISTNKNILTDITDIYSLADRNTEHLSKVISGNVNQTSIIDTFYQGGFSNASSGGSFTSVTTNTNTNRIRTFISKDNIRNAMLFAGGTFITCHVDSGYKYALQIYNSSGIGQITFESKTADYVYSSNDDFYAIAWIGKSDDSAITPTDGTHFRIEISNQLKTSIEMLKLRSGNVAFENKFVPSSELVKPLAWVGSTLFPMQIMLTKYGGAYGHDFDVNKHYKHFSGGKTYYVNSITGDDNNSGLKPELPLKTITEAISKTDVETIMIAEGIYYKGVHWTSDAVTKPLNIIGIGVVVLDAGGNVEPMKFTEGCYIKNIIFRSGNTNVRVTLDEEEFVFDSCVFMNSLSSNGVTILGGHIIMYKCYVTGAYLDGFNYHKQSGYHAPQVIEIECSGDNCGNPAVSADSQNVSTGHDTNTRIIRIGCEYSTSKGTVVADADSARSINIAVKASCSVNLDTATRDGNFGALSLAQMWLYDCESYGSPKDIIADNATINTTDTYDVEYTVNSGTIVHLT